MDGYEYKFAKNIINISNIQEIIKHLKENFNVNAVYDEDKSKLILSVDNVNEGLQLYEANNYIKSMFDEDFLTTNIN